MPGSEQEYKYWGKRASAHEEHYLYIVGATINQELNGWLTGQFEDSDRVLELGCGSGNYSKMIAGKVKYLTTTDLAPEMVKEAEEKLSEFDNVVVQIEDCYNTSSNDSLFDAVLMVNLLHIVKGPVVVMKECHRVLKGNGRVVIVDVTGYGMRFLTKIALGFRYMKKWKRPAPYGGNFSPDKLAQIAQEAGFVVEELKLLGNDTKAVCLRGRKTKREDIRNEG